MVVILESILQVDDEWVVSLFEDETLPKNILDHLFLDYLFLAHVFERILAFGIIPFLDNSDYSKCPLSNYLLQLKMPNVHYLHAYQELMPFSLYNQNTVIFKRCQRLFIAHKYLLKLGRKPKEPRPERKRLAKQRQEPKRNPYTLLGGRRHFKRYVVPKWYLSTFSTSKPESLTIPIMSLL